MRGKFTKATFLTISLMMVLLIFTASFAVCINNAAATGRAYDLTLHVESGDPSILAGVSFNLWSVGGRSSDSIAYGHDVEMYTRDIVSFDKDGKLSVMCYARTDGSYKAYEETRKNGILYLDPKVYNDSLLWDFYYGKSLGNVPLNKDGLSLTAEMGNTISPDYIYKLDLNVTKEDELIFSGYIIFKCFANGFTPDLIVPLAPAYIYED